MNATVALGALGAFFAVIVGVRAVLQRTRTGDAGLRAFHKRSATAVLADTVWVGVTIAFCAAVLLAWSGGLDDVVTAPPWFVGAAVCAVGIACAFASQLAMGASWRIGLKPGEKTALVTNGVFGVVRNPIYTSVLTFLAGLALLVPNPLMLAAWPLALIGVEMQVRLVEEPHLREVHGDAYRAYCARVGRLLPLVGRARGVTLDA